MDGDELGNLHTTRQSSSTDAQIASPTLPSHNYATVYFYPTISPKVVVIPILSCIFGFPVLVFLVICGLRRRARKARIRDKRRNKSDHTMDASASIAIQSRAFNERTIRMKNGKRKTIVRFKPMPEIDLDTVVEEKSEFDAELSSSDLGASPADMVKRIESLQLYKLQKMHQVPSYGYSSFNKPYNNITTQRYNTSSNLGSVIEENIEIFEDIMEPSLVNAEQTLSLDSTNCDLANNHNAIPDKISISTGTYMDSSISLFSKEADMMSNSIAYTIPNQQESIQDKVKCKIVDIGGRKSIPNIVTISKHDNCVQNLSNSLKRSSLSTPPFEKSSQILCVNECLSSSNIYGALSERNLNSGCMNGKRCQNYKEQSIFPEIH